eukprot:3863539-Pyramimonas_sp.AAC.1
MTAQLQVEPARPRLDHCGAIGGYRGGQRGSEGGHDCSAAGGTRSATVGMYHHNRGGRAV